jgi:hypothetical protein
MCAQGSKELGEVVGARHGSALSAGMHAGVSGGCGEGKTRLIGGAEALAGERIAHEDRAGP